MGQGLDLGEQQAVADLYPAHQRLGRTRTERQPVQRGFQVGRRYRLEAEAGRSTNLPPRHHQRAAGAEGGLPRFAEIQDLSGCVGKPFPEGGQLAILIELSDVHKVYDTGEVKVPALRGVSMKVLSG